jgi:hypothetical protein
MLSSYLDGVGWHEHDDAERLPIPVFSEAGIAVMHQLSVSGERPAVLLRAFQSGTIPSGDLPELIAFAWTRDDSPTSGVSEAACRGVRACRFLHLSSGQRWASGIVAHCLPRLDR